MERSFTNSTPERIPSLDGLRALAIIGVVCAHYFHNLGYADFNAGSLAVRTFFILSGFLITGLLIKELDRTATIRLAKFYYRRTLRIFPPYYFYLFVVLAAAFLSGAPELFRSFAPPFAYISNYVDPHRWDLGHTWSLSVEEQFYLIYPGILVLIGRRKMMVLLALLIVAAPVVRVVDFQVFGQARWVGMGFHSNADALAVGCLLAYLRPHLHRSTAYLKIMNSRFVLLVVPAIILLNAQSDHPNVFAVLVSAINVLVVFGLDHTVTNHENNAFGRVLNSRPLVKLGAMSYSIYLWQQPFLDPYSENWITVFPYNFAGIALFSCLSYFAVERISLRMRQRWEARIFGDNRSILPVLDESILPVPARTWGPTGSAAGGGGN